MAKNRNIRVSDDDWESWGKDAKKHGLTISSLVRLRMSAILVSPDGTGGVRMERMEDLPVAPPVRSVPSAVVVPMVQSPGEFVSSVSARPKVEIPSKNPNGHPWKCACKDCIKAKREGKW